MLRYQRMQLGIEIQCCKCAPVLWPSNLAWPALRPISCGLLVHLADGKPAQRHISVIGQGLPVFNSEVLAFGESLYCDMSFGIDLVSKGRVY
jgi:hypothetical protein